MYLYISRHLNKKNDMQKQTLLSIACATPTNTTTNNTDSTDNNKPDNSIDKQTEKNNQPSITPQIDNTCVSSNKEEVYIYYAFNFFFTIMIFLSKDNNKGNYCDKFSCFNMQ